MVKKISGTVLAFLVCYAGLFVQASSADTVKLKSGREISGALIEINDQDVVLGLGPGKIWFRKETVELVNGLSIEEMQTTLNSAKAFIAGDKQSKDSASFKEGLRYVSSTRKLEFKEEPKVEILSKEKLKEDVKKKAEKDLNPEELDARAKLLKKLGLIPDVESYKKAALDLFAEAVAAYYDTQEKKIFASEDTSAEALPGLPSIGIMHEQTHALQDQHFDLEKIEESILSVNDDKASAITSVIEGEATLLMFDAFLRASKSWGKRLPSEKEFNLRGFIMDTMLASAKHYKDDSGKPAVFIEELLFPYIWGGIFIQHTVDTKGWKEVDALYQDMPVSSEQIMHPEKYYISRDMPQDVQLPDISGALSPEWQELSKNSMGEFGFYLSGKKFLDELSAKVMSEGWGGDSYALYEGPGGQLLLVWLSKWDSENDAKELFNLYKKIVEKKYKGLSLVKDEEGMAQWNSPDQNIYIRRDKDSVLIIEGAPESLLGGLTSAFSTGSKDEIPQS